MNKHAVLTGTLGIGKSAFLVYFTIRLLATGSNDNPPIVIFQVKEGSECYAYGRLSIVRYGDIQDSGPLLDLPRTWYLVDSYPNPRLESARTIISASPKTLMEAISGSRQTSTMALLHGHAGRVKEMPAQRRVLQRTLLRALLRSSMVR